ncbi:PsiF repeat-containing protein [Comamonas aquatilis]|uniref:hypothetical protein n=1 Tax=Comamonas aquatilis TaxID=1778406 RepID=UPI0039F12D0C
MPALNSKFVATVALAVLSASLTLRTPQAQAASTNKAEKRQSGRIKIQNIRSSSEETPAERDRRLYRECQGRPNAGACAGYTHKPPKGKR